VEFYSVENSIVVWPSAFWKRQNRDTNDATFVTKRYQQITNDQTTTGFLLFVVARSWLWTSTTAITSRSPENNSYWYPSILLYYTILKNNHRCRKTKRSDNCWSSPRWAWISSSIYTLTLSCEFSWLTQPMKIRLLQIQIPYTYNEERSIKRGPSAGITQLDWSGYAEDVAYICSPLLLSKPHFLWLSQEVNCRIEAAKNKFSSMKNLLLNHKGLFTDAYRLITSVAD